MKRILYFTIILSFIVNIVKGQNTGPSAPEAASFEPVDAQNMVNLSTGDFTYTLPLLNVPGPGGGYPIALSYHAGIRENHEASWVGLGWNINPGAINRNLVGNPDDIISGVRYRLQHVDPENKTAFNAWLGLKLTDEFSLKLNTTWGDYTGVGASISAYGCSLGLDYTVDNSSSQGIFSYDVSAPLNLLSFSGAHSSDGKNSYSADLISQKISWNNQSSKLTTETGGISAIIESLGSSLASGDFAAVTSGLIGFGNINFTSHLNKNDVFLSSKGDQYSYLLFGFGKQQSSFWVNKFTDYRLFGSLYNYNASDENGFLEGPAFQESYYGCQLFENKTDVFDLAESHQDGIDIKYESNNFQLPAYDSYSVNAQGLNGTMSLKYLKSSNLAGNGYILESFDEGEIKKELRFQYNDSETNKRLPASMPDFYMLGKNESYYQNQPGSFGFDATNNEYTYDNEVLNTYNALGQSNFNSAENRLGASQYIRYYLVDDIINNISEPEMADFLDSEDAGDRSSVFESEEYGIGAFSITDNDGITFHYSLPVYQYEETMLAQENADNFVLDYNANRYAFTWLLTAITGPDYVDNPPYHELGDEDYGYWVKFSYGKWADGYVWQNPYSDIAESNIVTRGRKEVYYLNTIETKTHAALFVKELRVDGYSKIVNEEKDLSAVAVEQGEDIFRFRWPDYDFKTNWWTGDISDDFTSTENVLSSTDAPRVYPLRLDKIVLLDKNDYDPELSKNSQNPGSFASIVSGDVSFRKTYKLYRACNEDYMSPEQIEDRCTSDFGEIVAEKDAWRALYSMTYESQFEENVIDVEDDDVLDFESNALKVIQFNYDELTPVGNIPNSNYSNDGALTLKEVEFKGRQGAKYVPSYKFDYFNFTTSRFDHWGYDLEHPENFSLKSILTPTGGGIEIEYESDSYTLAACLDETYYSTAASSWDETTASKRYEYIDVDGDNVLEYVHTGFVFEVTFDCSHLPSNVISTESSQYLTGYIPFKNNIDENTYKFFSFDLQDCYDVSYNGDGEMTIKFIINESIDYRKVNEKGPLRLALNYIPPSGNELNGGGVRVKQITLNNEQVTEYNYDNPSTGLVSGVTSYTPQDVPFYIPYQEFVPGPGVMYEFVTQTSEDNQGNVLSSSTTEFEVLKKYTINETTGDYELGKILKIQQTQPNTHMGTGDAYNDQDAVVGDREFYSRVANIKSSKGILGRINRVITKNPFGDITEDVNFTYSEPEEKNTGVLSETFLTSHRLITWDDDVHSGYNEERFIGAIGIEEYTNELIEKQTKTSSGTIIERTNEVDFNTGQPISTSVIGPTGVENISMIIPAYTISMYSSMGMKSDAISNANMLTQTAGKLSYRKIGENEKVIGAGVQTWNNDWEGTYVDWDDYSLKFNYQGSDNGNQIWRKHKTYAWNGSLDSDGFYSADFDDFSDPESLKSWWLQFQELEEGLPDEWIKASEVTRYDRYSEPIEVMDINGDFTAEWKDINSMYTIAGGLNTNLGSFGATSFEEEELQGIGGIDGYYSPYRRLSVNAPDDGVTPKINKINAHSGHYYLELITPVTFYSDSPGLMKNTKYIASVWVHSLSDRCMMFVQGYTDGNSNTNCNYSTILDCSLSESRFGDWHLLNFEFDVADEIDALRVEIAPPTGEKAYVDDFRVAPYDAAIGSYAYDETGNVIAMLDANNFATKYTYDNGGRLVKTERETDEGFAKTAAYDYNYSGRFSINPTTTQEIGYEGAYNLEFGYTKSSDLTLDFSETSDWIDITSLHANYFTVQIDQNDNCATELTGDLVVKTNEESIGEVRIPFIQHAPPSYFNIYFTDENDDALTDNEFHIGNRYHVKFDFCESVDNVDLVVCQYDGDLLYRRIVKFMTIEDPYSTQSPYSVSWTVPEDPDATDPSLNWQYGHQYRIRLEDHNTHEELAVSDIIVIQPIEQESIVIQKLTFIEPTLADSPLQPAENVYGDNKYAVDITWYTNYWNYKHLMFYLEVWNSEYGSKLWETPLLGQNTLDWQYVNVDNGSGTWIFFDYEIENFIFSKTSSPQSSYFYRIRAAEYQGDPNACETGDCTSAYTDMFEVDGLDLSY